MPTLFRGTKAPLRLADIALDADMTPGPAVDVDWREACATPLGRRSR
jgi:hypothetical protein